MQSNPVEVEPAPNRTPYILLAVGCGVLFLVSICCIPGAVYYAYFTLEEPEVVEWDVPAPPPAEPPHVMPLSPVSPSDPNVPAFRTVRIQVTEVQGLSTTVGSECRFQVERRSRRDGTFWCHTVVACGGPSLFGNENQGFFNCNLYEGVQRHVQGDDPQTSSEDRDAAFHIDTLAEEFEVRDDASGPRGAFLLRGRVLGVD
ncbi:MAG: hypothetical protein AB8I08_36335 [Sandaracinaceae bacterium]